VVKMQDQFTVTWDGVAKLVAAQVVVLAGCFWAFS
jgi:hypothetical protein